jgi:hypothetical protein
MPRKTNPLKLNKLQLKTLAIMQYLAESPETSVPNEDGTVLITFFPQPHGNHFHVRDRVVMSADATGLSNEAVWTALHRRGLAVSGWPAGITLTPEGLAYPTGIRDDILIGSDH